MMFPFCMDCVSVPISAESERHRFPEKICPHDGNAEAPLFAVFFHGVYSSLEEAAGLWVWTLHSAVFNSA